LAPHGFAALSDSEYSLLRLIAVRRT